MDASLQLIWMDPAELAENPANWRTHPEAQLKTLTDVMSEVGWAGACLYNKRTNRLVDGHARRKVALEQGVKSVPVLVGDWSEEVERKILASLDPIAGQAGRDEEKLKALIAEIDPATEGLRKLCDDLLAQSQAKAEEDAEGEPEEEKEIPEQYQILVILKNEVDQVQLLEELSKRGFQVRSLIS